MSQPYLFVLFKGIRKTSTSGFQPLDAAYPTVQPAGLTDSGTPQPRKTLPDFLKVNFGFTARLMRFTIGLVKKVFGLPSKQSSDHARATSDLEKFELSPISRRYSSDLFLEKSPRFAPRNSLAMIQSVISPTAKLDRPSCLRNAFHHSALSDRKRKVHWAEPLVTAIHKCPSDWPQVRWAEPLVTAVHDYPSARSRIRWSDPLVTAVYDCPPGHFTTPERSPPISLGCSLMTASENLRWLQPVDAEVHLTDSNTERRAIK